MRTLGALEPSMIIESQNILVMVYDRMADGNKF